MNKNTKVTLGSIFLFLSSFIYFFLAYKGVIQQNINQKDYDKTVKVIVDKGIDYRYSSKGWKSECFYILLEGMNKKLGVYRMSENYQDLIQKFKIGDTVTIYFRDNHNTTENINIDLVQVEKGGQILLEKKEYEHKQRSLIYLGLLGGIASVIASYYIYKKKINITRF